jgi:hypothetical protein
MSERNSGESIFVGEVPNIAYTQAVEGSPQ